VREVASNDGCSGAVAALGPLGSAGFEADGAGNVEAQPHIAMEVAKNAAAVEADTETLKCLNMRKASCLDNGS
jgi:hypothetical protein